MQVIVELVQDIQLENMKRQYESKLNSLGEVIVLTSHSNRDLNVMVRKVT